MVKPPCRDEIIRPKRKVLPDRIVSRADEMKPLSVKMFPHLKDNIKTIISSTDGFHKDRPTIKVSFKYKPEDQMNNKRLLNSYDSYNSNRGKTFHKYNETNSRIYTGGLSDSRGLSSSKRILPKDNISNLLYYSEGPKFRKEVKTLI
jgi:hypothetical protein